MRFVGGRRHTEALSRQLGWLRELPVQAMIDARWIEERGCELEQAQTLLEWYGVTTPEAWRSVYVAPQAGFRHSPAFTGEPGALAAWLQAGEEQACWIDTRHPDQPRTAIGGEEPQPAT